MTKPAHSEPQVKPQEKEGDCLCGAANNPKGYTDELGQKHEWILDGESVWHKVDGRTHSVQGVEGFLAYGVASLLQYQKQAAISAYKQSDEWKGVVEAIGEMLAERDRMVVSGNYNGLNGVSHKLRNALNKLNGGAR